MNTENIPVGYKPYQEVLLCSNKIIGGGYFFNVNGVIPLLIGVGPKPIIWLNAVTQAEEKAFTPIVDSSTSLHPLIRVSEDEKKL